LQVALVRLFWLKLVFWF